MPVTRQELLGLLVVSVLLATAAFARWLVPAPSEWIALPGDDGVDAVRAETAREVEANRRRAVPLAPGERIDLNEADEVELARLPGIGPALAERIVTWREGRGGVSHAEELLEVSGIGPGIMARIRDRVRVEPGLVAARPATPGGQLVVQVNRADAAELERLPGVGPVLAERIVQSRSAEGPFRSVEDLTRVPGVGPATATRLAPMIDFDTR